MQWRVTVELSGADGSVQTHEVHVGGCLPAVCSAETPGLDTGASQTAVGRTAASYRSGPDGGILPQPAPLPAMRRATPAEGPAPSTAALAVRRRGSSCAPFRSLPLPCGPSPDLLASRRD